MWEQIKQVFTSWFENRKDREHLIRDFNKSSRAAYIAGIVPTLFEAKISVGDSRYTHAFSKWAAGGFRIKALTGRNLNRSEMEEMGKVVLVNSALVRNLVSLGFDTLELHSDVGNIGLKWELKKYIDVVGYL
ncbi:hypothetical protein [Flavobacterium sp.]|uniref:hypothetical protein n=1 Tax=Flavobacterium sp. TaxID=239 RepID=UPI0038D04749